MERPEWQLDQELLNSDDHAERGDFERPRPYASDSRSGQLRSVAGPRHERCERGVRPLEALRCPADAVLSREYADQFRGE